jgi:hypothetical protein
LSDDTVKMFTKKILEIIRRYQLKKEDFKWLFNANVKCIINTMEEVPEQNYFDYIFANGLIIGLRKKRAGKYDPICYQLARYEDNLIQLYCDEDESIF